MKRMSGTRYRRKMHCHEVNIKSLLRLRMTSNIEFSRNPQVNLIFGCLENKSLVCTYLSFEIAIYSIRHHLEKLPSVGHTVKHVAAPVVIKYSKLLINVRYTG